jgi:hypothetical protein
LGGTVGPGDEEHERALMRAFELRHPMLALALRMIRRRPFTGSIMAILFVAVSTIAYEGFSAVNKRFATWLDINYVSQWQAHDRAQGLQRVGDEQKKRLDDLAVHEGVAMTIPPGHGITVYYGGDTTASTRAWDEVPADGVDYDMPLSEYAKASQGHHFTMPPGDQIAAFRLSTGDPAQIEIDGKPYVLIHAMWWPPSSPWHWEFPLDFRARHKVCLGDTVDQCSLYGHISRADFDALGFAASDMRSAPMVANQVLPSPPDAFGPPYGDPVAPYPPADLSGIRPVVTPVDDGASFVELPREWVTALVKIASAGFYKAPFASQLLAQRLEFPATPRIDEGTPYSPYLIPYPGHPVLPRIPVLVSYQDPYLNQLTTGILVTIDDGPFKGKVGLLKFNYEFERLYKPAIAAWKSPANTDNQSSASMTHE